MMTPVAGGAHATHRAAAPAVRRSSDLDAQLASDRSRLADWVTCPSATTPAGKAKIEQITTHFNAVKAQIRKADDRPELASPSAAAASDNGSTRSADAVNAVYTVGGGRGGAGLGLSVDRYA